MQKCRSCWELKGVRHLSWEWGGSMRNFPIFTQAGSPPSTYRLLLIVWRKVGSARVLLLLWDVLFCPCFCWKQLFAICAPCRTSVQSFSVVVTLTILDWDPHQSRHFSLWFPSVVILFSVFTPPPPHFCRHDTVWFPSFILIFLCVVPPFFFCPEA